MLRLSAGRSSCRDSRSPAVSRNSSTTRCWVFFSIWPTVRHTSLVFPVRSSCIMPCLRARVLSRRSSRAASLGVHVGENVGDGGLFVENGAGNAKLLRSPFEVCKRVIALPLIAH